MEKRQIKFRAWDKMEEKMVYHFFSLDNNGDCFNANRPQENLPYELMQFTGLHDKNGKEIYEGDVVEMYMQDTSPMPLKIKTAVSFYEGTFCVLKMNSEPLSVRDAIIVSGKAKQGLEIIGNIYETPDLVPQDKIN